MEDKPFNREPASSEVLVFEFVRWKVVNVRNDAPALLEDGEVPNGQAGHAQIVQTSDVCKHCIAQAVVFWGGLFGMITVPVFTASCQVSLLTCLQVCMCSDMV